MIHLKFSSGSGHPTDGEVGGYEKVDEQVNEVTIDLGKVGDGKVIVDVGSKGII